MTKQNEIMLKVVEEAKEVGIKVVFEEAGIKVKMSFYIDEPEKFDDDYFRLYNKDEVVLFEIKRGELIGESRISYDTKNNARLDSLKITESYLSILSGIESKDDYVDENDYDARLMDAGEAQPIGLCDSLTTYFLARLDGYIGEFWQYIHPDVNQFNLYQ